MTATASPFKTASDGVLDRLRMPIAHALGLAGQIERGQASTPLRDHIESMSLSLDAAPFAITLLGLDAPSRAAALGWLCGADFHVLSIEVQGAVGLVEVQLAEHGYVLVKSGRRQEFDRLEPFLEAVRAADLVRQGDANAWLEPMHLEVGAPRGLQGLKLVMPASPAAMAESFTLVARLRSESNLLVVAGPADRQLDLEEDRAIRGLAAAALATWAIVFSSSPPGSKSPVWSTSLDGAKLPSVHLDPDADPPPVPAFLLNDRSGLRQGLFACQQARRFETAVDMLEERIEQDLRQHEARRKMLLRRTTPLGDLGQERTLREAVEIIRRKVEESLAKLEAQLGQTQRERLLPTSVPNNKINNLLEDVTSDDIARETTGQIVQLNVAPAFREKVRRLVSDIVRADVHDDLARLNSEMNVIADRTASELNAEVGGNLSVEPLLVDESAVWESLYEAIHLNSRYHAELAQKGSREQIFEFVMHCRTPVFLMGAVVTPIYSYLPSLREHLMKLSPLLLLGGAYWAYLGMREEKHKAMEREVVRLRDMLGTEVRSLYHQALRDWSDRVTHHLRDSGKTLGHQMEQHMKVRAAELTSSSVRERTELQDKRKSVDNRLGELGGLMQQAGRARLAAVEARQTLERAACDAIRDLGEQPRRA